MPSARRLLTEALAAKSLSVPLVFEPNQGQTAAPVKFVAHGAGYGLFLTSDEAVLALQGAAIKNQHSAFSSQSSAPSSQRAPGSVIRMRLEGDSSARVFGSAPLPGRTATSSAIILRSGIATCRNLGG